MTDHTQLTRDDIAAMSHAEVLEARRLGRLNEVMGIPTPATAPERPTLDELKTMTSDQIAHALTEGRLEHIFRPGPPVSNESTDPDGTEQTTEENN